jgi:glucose/arabinose dehydrogenase
MSSRASLLATAALSVTVFLACQTPSSNSPQPPPTPPSPTVPPTPPAALEFQTVNLEVASGLNGAPLDVTRPMTIPKGFKLSVYARVPGARFMRLAPNGDLFVSQPGNINSSDPNQDGKILLVRADGGGNPSVTTFASGLRKPHDMTFVTVGGKTYLYFSESHQISRAEYKSGDSSIGAKTVLIPDLPDNSSGELQGKYGHALKNFVVKGDKLYLSIASATNADPADLAANPKRGAIYEYTLDGKNPRLFAQGLRNAEGLDIEPSSNDLWVVVNNRDNIKYPPGHPKAGQLDQAYVDNHPPEPFTKVRDGGHYGWPFCNPNPDAGLTNLPFDRDYDTNADGKKLNCDTADRVSIGIQAHSAPLGLSFVKTQRLEGAVTGLHGSWNRTQKTGYKVAYFPFSGGQSGAQVDLVTGFLVGNNAWGRPVDVIGDGAQGLYISDDGAGAIYHLEPQ